MELKITKGDWKSDYFTVESNRKIVADCGFSDNGHDKEERANAHLIAAAPDMYLALSAMIEFYVGMVNSGDCGNWDPEDDCQVSMGRKVLAKARGE